LLAEGSLRKRVVNYRIHGTGTAAVPHANQMIGSLTIKAHDLTRHSDRAMEQHQSTTTDLPPDRAGYLSDRGWDKSVASTWVEASLAAPVSLGRESRNGGGVNTTEMDSVDPGGFRPDFARDRLQAIRRGLWIMSATLESLPAKIKSAYHTRGELVGRDGPVQPSPTSNESSAGPLIVKAQATLRGWPARWKIARLKARAVRAERRAAAAIGDASASFGEALEAVLHAAIARVKADEACLNTLRPSTFRRGE
jgi:hypothetical protein